MRQSRSPHGLFTFVLLGTALVLSGILAYAAVDSSRRHRATARAVLQDYVTFAAEQFAQRFTQDVEYYGLYPTMQLLSRTTGTLPEPSSLLQNADRQLSQSLELAVFFFRYDPRDGTLDFNASASPPPDFRDAMATQTQRTGADASLRGFLVESDGNLRGFLVESDGNDDPRMFFFRAGTDVDPTIVGFEAKVPVLREYSKTAFDNTQLLPASVTGDIPNSSVIAISFVRSSGNLLWNVTDTSAATSDEPAARGVFPLTNGWPGMELRAAFLDHFTNEVVAGGVPRSRIPLTVVLAFATAVMLIATVIQTIRERSLAKLRAEFVSSVSHELRTPLAQIRMFAETLRLGRMPSHEERDRSLAIIDKEARRLTNLVENVLLFSKPGKTIVTGNMSQTNLSELVREVVESYRPLADARAVLVETNVAAVSAPVDAPALKQAILNLIDNAIKYGPEGQTVRVTLSLSGDDARIAVEDQGPGVPSAKRSVIWNRFERLARDRESTTTGAGIGLAVVRQLMTLQGGQCWVEDGEVGARFVLTVGDATTHGQGTNLEPKRTTIGKSRPAS